MRLANKRLCVSMVLAAASAFAGGCAFAQGSGMQEVKFSLDFIPLGRFSPWYVALAKGYYRDEGLNVTISSARGSADGIRMIESGVADIGHIDIPGLVASGSITSVKVAAVVYQKAPYCVFSLNPGANVTRPQDLAGLELGSSTASFTPRIIQAFMRMHNLDPASLRIVNIDPPARVAMLVARKVPAMEQFIMSEPGIRRAVKDAEVKCLLLGDHGLDLYGSGIGVKDETLKSNPELVRKFVRAAMRGFRDSFADPNAAARIMLQYQKALDPQVIAEEIDAVKRLMVVPDTQKNGLGWFSAEKMKNTVEFMNANADISGQKMSPTELYREGFVPKEPVRP